MSDDLLYQIALTLVPNIGCVQAKILIDHFGSAREIFKAREKDLERIESIGLVRAKSILDFNDFFLAEQEIQFIEKYNILPLFLTNEHYPKRLLRCYDAPSILYYKGNADLNAPKAVSIIGTRTNTDYGKLATEKLVEELKLYQVLVISGLAFGIDAIAHKAAMLHQLPTVAALAHGLHTIYPSQHKTLAREMLQTGGLLTEMSNGIKPDKHNFPRRNRIVAGMADVTIVIETALRGGSMITAELANSYNRDVFAFPGKTTDAKSAGCNHLIKTGKAKLFTDVQELAEIMGWEKKKTKPKVQRELFVELSDEERNLVDVLKDKDTVHIDELYIKSGLSSSSVAAAILSLELQGLIICMPGKLYKLA